MFNIGDKVYRQEHPGEGRIYGTVVAQPTLPPGVTPVPGLLPVRTSHYADKDGQNRRRTSGISWFSPRFLHPSDR